MTTEAANRPSRESSPRRQKVPQAVVSVLVPSYHRSEELRRCLEALAVQTRPADEVVVVARRDDLATLAVCAGATQLPALRTILVSRPGIVAALNTGYRAVAGEIVAITDDDCRPEPDWIERICEEFAADPRVGAVGGPDILPEPVPEEFVSSAVGRIHWFGRITGNHHAGTSRQYVHFLKGANMAYRAEALIPFNERLRGHGAQVGNDMQASLAVWRRGYRVLYSPAVRVRHFPGPRPTGQPRLAKDLRLLRDQLHNEMCVLSTTLPAWRLLVTVGYAMLVGYRSSLGLAQLGLRLMHGPRRAGAMAEFAWTNLGRLEGLMSGLRARLRLDRAGGAGAP